ncbi:RNA-dependent RNA polymerase [Erysiphe necator associated ourmia-like virus 29]|nr:RNA-dependent RNA polymerase [Erysiphe necator associated ourmia-like virus 29]
MVIRSSKDMAGGSKDALRISVGQLKVHLEFTASLTGLKCPELPNFNSISEIKQFCCLIEGRADHPWGTWWRTIGPEKVRYSFAHSLFLFRKTLPSGDRDQAVKSFLKKMTVRPAKVDPRFLEHLSREIPKMFPKGWDRFYLQEARNLCLSTSSCLEVSRSNSGSRGASQPLTRLAYQKSVGLEPFEDNGHYCKVVPVESGGKWRVVTVNSGQCEALRPLHHTMYNYLSRKSWLCRGNPNVSGFHQKEGEIFFSGDYESATDAIPIKTYQHMLGLVLNQCENVPDSVKEFAFLESRKTFMDENLNTIGIQRRGQLMGSYLSFPFLCLLNYMCFTYSIKRRVPVLINGDDIVFRSTEEEGKRWMENVQRSGLVLSRGKTLVHPRIFTLNSLLFRGGKDIGKPVGFFRPKCFFQCPKSGAGAAGQFNSLVVGFPGSPHKDRIQVGFLCRYRSFLLRRQRSLRSDLGFRISDRVLRMGGFSDHEKFYSTVDNGDVIGGGGLIPGGFVKCPLPKGKTRRDARVSEDLFFREMIELTWIPVTGSKVQEKEVFGRFRYHPKPKSSTMGIYKMLRGYRGSQLVPMKKRLCSNKGGESYWKCIRSGNESKVRTVFSGWLVGSRVETEVLVFKGRYRSES